MNKKIYLLISILLVIISNLVSAEVMVERMPIINMTFIPVANSNCDNPFDTGNIYFICASQFGWAYYSGINGRVTEQYNISLNGTHNCLNVSMKSYVDENDTWIDGYESYLIYGSAPNGEDETVQCAWDTKDMMASEQVANPSLEYWNTATDIDNGFNSGSFSRTSTTVHTGTYAGYTTANNGYLSFLQVLEPNNYTYRFWYNCSNTYDGLRFRIRYQNYDSAGYLNWNGTAWNQGVSSYYFIPPVCTGDWQESEYNFTMEDYGLIEIIISEYSATASNLLFVDDVSLTRTNGERRYNPSPNTMDVNGVSSASFGHNKWTQSYIDHTAPWNTLLPAGSSAIIDKDDVHQTTSSSGNAYRGINQRIPEIGWDNYHTNIPSYFNRSNGMCGVWFYGASNSYNDDMIKAFYDDKDCLSNAIINSMNVKGGYFYDYAPSSVYSYYPTSIELFGGFQDTRYNTSYDRTNHGFGVLSNMMITVAPGSIRTKKVNYTNAIIFNNVYEQWIEPVANFNNVKFISTSSSFVINGLYGTQTNFQPYGNPGGITTYTNMVGYGIPANQRVQFRYSNAYATEFSFSDNNFYDGSHVALTYQTATGSALYRQTTNTTMRNINFINTITPTSSAADIEHFCDYIDNDATMNYTFSVNLYNVVTDRVDYDYRPAMVRYQCEDSGIFDNVLIKGWNTLKFRTLDNNYNVLENVNITVTDAIGNIYSGLTNSSGELDISVLNWYVPLKGGTTGYTLIPYSEYVSLNNYTITYSKQNYITQYNALISLSEDYSTDVVMPSWVINGSLVILPGSNVIVI